MELDWILWYQYLSITSLTIPLQDFFGFKVSLKQHDPSSIQKELHIYNALSNSIGGGKKEREREIEPKKWPLLEYHHSFILSIIIDT